MRILHWLFLASVVLLAVAAEIAGQNLTPIEGIADILLVCLIVAGGTEIAICIFLRRKQLNEASEILHGAPEDHKGWEKWRSATLFCMVSGVTFCLFGVMMRLVAGNLLVAIPFYVVALFLLLVWSPRLPERA